LLAVTLHEWLDIAIDSGGTYLMWAALACIPLWPGSSGRGPIEPVSTCPHRQVKHER
jgi:hypothetical protein